MAPSKPREGELSGVSTGQRHGHRMFTKISPAASRGVEFGRCQVEAGAPARKVGLGPSTGVWLRPGAGRGGAGGSLGWEPGPCCWLTHGGVRRSRAIILVPGGSAPGVGAGGRCRGQDVFDTFWVPTLTAYWPRHCCLSQLPSSRLPPTRLLRVLGHLSPCVCPVLLAENGSSSKTSSTCLLPTGPPPLRSHRVFVTFCSCCSLGRTPFHP